MNVAFLIGEAKYKFDGEVTHEINSKTYTKSFNGEIFDYECMSGMTYKFRDDNKAIYITDGFENIEPVSGGTFIRRNNA